jgi:hypothetical protein
MAIADSKSVKNTDAAGETGYDAGKKIAGVKARLAADTGGLPQAVRVTTANVTGRDGAIETLRTYVPNLSKVAKVLRGGGYSRENFANAIRLLLEAGVVKRNEPRTFAYCPSGGLLSAPLRGLKSIAVFGKTVNARYIARTK